jgi:predicted short-subunit dehydrogenase-like oxidoreductase (DUF2520 family)
MSSQTFVTIVGAGNVAWHLAPALDNAGFAVREVYSRQPPHAEALTERLYQAEVCSSLDFSTSTSNVFVLAISDDALLPVVRELVLPEEAVLVHVSGSQPLEVLDYAATEHTGVLYPLQTFTKEKRVDFSALPIFIEARTAHAENLLFKMARALSREVNKIGSSQRLALHLGAVVASNFANHMWWLAQQILRRNELDYRWLEPLIAETVQKSLLLGPELAQTGPARRGDLETLDKHYQFLADQPAFAELYQQISQHILNTYQPD